MELDAARVAIDTEIQRIEEDCDHSGKSHFNAADRWGGYNFWLGIGSTVLSVVAGAAFLKDFPAIAATLSTIVAVLAGLMTFVKPSERSAAHKSSGDQYLSLKNDARVFRHIKLVHSCDQEGALAMLDELNSRRKDLNSTAPQFSQADRLKARRGIESGESTHRADGK